MERNAGDLRNSLTARGVGVHFEGLRALEGIDLDLARGEILGLIGPNGAGKTTLVNVLSGFQKPSLGTVELDGQLTTAGRRTSSRAAVSGALFRPRGCSPT